MEDAKGNLVQIAVLADFVAGATIGQIARRIRVSRLSAEDRLREALYIYGFTQAFVCDAPSRVAPIISKSQKAQDITARNRES